MSYTCSPGGRWEGTTSASSTMSRGWRPRRCRPLRPISGSRRPSSSTGDPDRAPHTRISRRAWSCPPPDILVGHLVLCRLGPGARAAPGRRQRRGPLSPRRRRPSRGSIFPSVRSPHDDTASSREAGLPDPARMTVFMPRSLTPRSPAAASMPLQYSSPTCTFSPSASACSSWPSRSHSVQPVLLHGGVAEVRDRSATRAFLALAAFVDRRPPIDD